MSTADALPAALVPLPRVAGPMLLGLVAEPLGWLLIAAAYDPAWYGRSTLLLGVHLVVFGALLLPILGAAWQLVPVVAARPPRFGHHAGHLSAAAVGGALAVWVGMALDMRVAAVGGGVLILALLARSFAVVHDLLGATGRVGIRGWLLLAELALWVGLALAVALLAGRNGCVILAPILGIGWHAATLGLGWVGGWELGLGALLVPMFGLGPEPRPAWTLVGAGLWFAGLGLGAPVLWAAGAWWTAAVLLRALVRGRSTSGPALVQVALALVGLALAAAFGAAGWLVGPALVGALLVGWLIPFQHGIATRIVPFLAWSHLLAGSARSPRSLVPDGLAWMQVGVGLIGGVGLVAGLAGEHGSWVRVAALAMAAAAGLHAGVVARVGIAVFQEWRHMNALAGTEAR